MEELVPLSTLLEYIHHTTKDTYPFILTIASDEGFSLSQSDDVMGSHGTFGDVTTTTCVPEREVAVVTERLSSSSSSELCWLERASIALRTLQMGRGQPLT